MIEKSDILLQHRIPRFLCARHFSRTPNECQTNRAGWPFHHFVL